MKRKTTFIWLVTLFLAVLSLGLVGVLEAQERQPSDDEVNSIARELYCPVCPNTPLDACETQACKDWRDEIRAQLSSGWSKEQVIAYFVERYGERVLAEPQRSGFNSLLWSLPVVGSLLGLVVVIQALRTWLGSRDPTPESASTLSTGSASAVSSEVRARIERELQELI